MVLTHTPKIEAAIPIEDIFLNKLSSYTQRKIKMKHKMSRFI